MLRVDLHARDKSNGTYDVDNHCTDRYGFLAANVYLQIPSTKGKKYNQPRNWSDNMLQSPLQYVLAVGKRGQRITLGFLNEYLKKDEKFRTFCSDMCRLPSYNTDDDGFKTAFEDYVEYVELSEFTKIVVDRYGKSSTKHDYWHMADDYVIQRVNDAFRQGSQYLHPDKPGGSVEKLKQLEDVKSKTLLMMKGVVEESGQQRKYLRRKRLMPLVKIQAIFDAVLLRKFGAGRLVCSSVHPVQISFDDRRNYNTFIYGRSFECEEFSLSYAHDPANPMPAA